MALTNLTGLALAIPPVRRPFAAATPTMVALLSMTTTSHRAAMILEVPRTGTLHAVGFATGAVTTAEDLRVSFQDVSLTTGNPDGTEDQFRDVASASLAANDWITTGMLSDDGTDGGVPRSVTRGDLLAIVIRFASTAGSVTIRAPDFVNATSFEQFPYAPTSANAGSSWTKNLRVGFGLQYDDGVWVPLQQVLPAKNIATQTYSSSSTPDECGLRFRLPFACKVNGFWADAYINNGSMELYDSDGSTVLISRAQDGDVRVSAAPNIEALVLASDITLSANTWYRLTYKAGSASAQLRYVDVASAAIMNALQLGADAHWTERTDSGSWTDTTTRRPLIGLYVSAIDVTAAGGGGEVSHIFVG